jgi:adenylylsulfate kinase-like enzyme
VSDPYEEPLTADLVIDTEQEQVDESVAKLVALVEERLSRAETVGAPA